MSSNRTPEPKVFRQLLRVALGRSESRRAMAPPESEPKRQVLDSLLQDKLLESTKASGFGTAKGGPKLKVVVSHESEHGLPSPRSGYRPNMGLRMTDRAIMLMPDPLVQLGRSVRSALFVPSDRPILEEYALLVWADQLSA